MDVLHPVGTVGHPAVDRVEGGSALVAGQDPQQRRAIAVRDEPAPGVDQQGSSHAGPEPPGVDVEGVDLGIGRTVGVPGRSEGHETGHGLGGGGVERQRRDRLLRTITGEGVTRRSLLGPESVEELVGEEASIGDLPRTDMELGHGELVTGHGATEQHSHADSLAHATSRPRHVLSTPRLVHATPCPRQIRPTAADARWRTSGSPAITFGHSDIQNRMGTMTYDLAIIGSGGAGFAAAIAATVRGHRVVMVERATVGGTCVNVGCIPSKALLAAAEVRAIGTEHRFPGIGISAGPTDMAAVVAGKAEIVDLLRKERYEDLAADYGWEILRGDARFVDGPALDVAGQRIEATHYLVATGASPWVPSVPGLEDGGYLTSTTALELRALPASLLIVGGNYVGLELGQTFARLGSEVTVIEALDRLAPGEEPEISEVITGVLRDEGVDVRTSAGLGRVSQRGGRVVAHLADGRQVPAEAILMATGRRPATAGLGLDAVGVETGPIGEIVVDRQLRTTHPRIWAAGDVTGAPQFVSVAGHHGTMVVDNAFGAAARTVDYGHLPRVAFTTPNIAAVGLTDAQAGQAGLSCTCRVVPLAYVPRAIVNRDTRGLVKVVAEQGTGRIVGVHIIAANAGDAILAATYALEAGMTVDQLATTWAPYLTMAEGIKLAAQSFRTDVARLSCCAG